MGKRAASKTKAADGKRASPQKRRKAGGKPDRRKRAAGAAPAGGAEPPRGIGGEGTQLPGTLLYKLASDDADRKLALQWLVANKEGTAPTQKQLAGLKRFLDGRTLEEMRIILRAMPKHVYAALSGRQRKVIDEQAARYDLPLTGATVNMGAVIRRFHDFLAENKHRLLLPVPTGDEDPLLSGPETAALERYRLAMAKRAEFALAREKGEWVRISEAHSDLASMAGILRKAGETLQRTFGNEAYAIMEEAYSEVEELIEKRFGRKAEG